MPTRRRFLALTAASTLTPLASGTTLTCTQPAAGMRLVVEADAPEAAHFVAVAEQTRHAACDEAEAALENLENAVRRDAWPLLAGFTRDAFYVVARQVLAAHNYAPVWQSDHVTQAGLVRHTLAGSPHQILSLARRLQHERSAWAEALARSTAMLGDSRWMERRAELELPAADNTPPSHQVFWILRRGDA